MTTSPLVRLGVDIGGTFTDVTLEVGGRRLTAKTLTTSRAPEHGMLSVLCAVVGDARLEPGDVSLIIH
ncbi:hydantoinase/oxoprolinase N-terminal domain-containing protein, partial [Klebsiella pneumoniae]|uniref:hydantoinase/oxoprolinase N-terminal domain-containing protein n=1 Tax=Klebsiella pneumoniae TaxID=573 RepID=UPI003013BB6E